MPILRDLIDLRLPTSGKWIALASIVGAVAGVGAIAFQMLTHWMGVWSLEYFANYVPGEAVGEAAAPEVSIGAMMPWMIVAVMTVGGLLSGLLVYTFAPEAEGHGTDAAIDAFHNRRGEIRARVPIVKTLASAITLGTGGSAGREGPIAQIGAGFGSWLGSRLKLSARDRRIMLAAGMGAGVGAIFRAPLAGAIFAAEILYSDGDLEADVLVPATTASIVAYSVYTQSLPQELRYVPLFGSDLNHAIGAPAELIAYAILACVLALAGAIYVKLFYSTHDLFRRFPIIPHFRPAIGAALAGIAGIGLYYALGEDPNALAVLGSGYGGLQKALTGASEVGIVVLSCVALVKIVTTSLTISSGGSGGVFGPSMVIGGCLSAAIGIFIGDWFPMIAAPPEAFAVVGMAGFFAGIARAPISTIIMVRAMTGDYELLVPTMLVTTLTFVACGRVRLYRKQVESRIDSPAHRGDFIVDVLEGLKVAEVYEPTSDQVLIAESMTLDEIVHRLPRTRQHYFPVVDDAGKMVGVFSDDDVRAYLYTDEIWKLAVASDVMRSDYLSVTPGDDLNTALKRITERNLEELPVLSDDSSCEISGFLTRKDIIAAYNRRVVEHKEAVKE